MPVLTRILMPVARLRGVALLLGLFTTPVAMAQPTLVEPPALADAVAAGTLDPVAERVPLMPHVTDPTEIGREIGTSGGEINLLFSRARDVRQMTVYGYARLVRYNAALELVADIAAEVTVEEGRIFTFKLREGHRWSDGAPFTIDDFRFYWDHIANDPDVSPYGPTKVLLVNGEPPVFETPDAHTVRYTWSTPNPYFLPSLAASSPLFIYAPAHYLRDFHGGFADADALAAKVEKAGTRNWAQMFNRTRRTYRQENPDLPTLQPWIVQNAAPAERFFFDRNPYFHRIDSVGNQLPYLDRVIANISAAGLIPAKTAAGESDLQARNLQFADYTVMKQAEDRADIRVRLWRNGRGNRLAINPNLNVVDPGWHALMNDVRFRRALSLAVDREEINQVLYFGLATPAANTLHSDSPLYDTDIASAYVAYDPDQANRLLDEMGLSERNGRGIRLMANGEPLQIIVETAGGGTEETDMLELVANTWREIGVELFSRPSQVEVFRGRIFAGEAVMSVGPGVENGAATADMSPTEFAPTTKQQYYWPRWGDYFETKGASGSISDISDVASGLLENLAAWEQARDSTARAAIWREMLQVHADQVFSIGTVTGVPQPVVTAAGLRNVPDEGLYNWNPGSHFGIHRVDLMWLAR